MKKLNVIYGCLFFVFLVSMCSCGSRKVSKSSNKEEIKSETKDNKVTEKQIDTNVKKTIEIKTDDKNETVTQETVYEPKDNTKESFVIEKDGSKVVLNNAKKIVRNTSQKNNSQSQTNKYVDSVIKDIQKENKAIEIKYEAKKESKAKEVEKEQFNYLSLWWVYLIVLAVVYFLLKRFRII